MLEKSLAVIVISLFLVAIITLPAARALKAKNIAPFSKRGLQVLAVLIITAVTLVLIEDFIGLSNPLGLILANSLGVALLGYYYVKKRMQP